MNYFERNNTKIFYKEWKNTEKPKAVLHIVHGMAEHILRYNDFANFLNNNGIDVYGMDARGHGKTGQNSKNLGHYKKNDWNEILEDIDFLMNIQMKNYDNNVPFFILGHSMGSFLTRNYINKFSPNISGAIIMGTGNSDSFLLYGFTKFVTSLKNKKDIAKFVHKSAFKNNNQKISNTKTSFDWLTSDDKEVKKYIDDPLCGMYMTNGFYNEFMKGMFQISKLEKNISKSNYISKTPILFVSGKDDPVGKYGQYVINTKNKYTNNKNQLIDIILYENMRHEILNEVHKQIVYDDILKFILKRS